MTSKKDTLAAGLLPNYFKKVGLAVILTTIAGLILIKSANLISTEVLQKFIPTIGINLILAGLLLIVLSRDKEEDELTLQLRWKAMVWAFIAASVSVIITPIVNLTFNISAIELSGQKIVMFMLIGFLIMYTYLKRIR